MNFYIKDYGIYFFEKVFQLYWPNMLYPIVIVISCFYIWKTKNCVWKNIFVYSNIVTVLTFLNPFIMYWVISMMSWSDRYYRFYWLIPSAYIMVFVIVDIISMQKDIIQKGVIVIFVIILLYVTGSNLSLEITTENIYGISDDVIKISQVIKEDKKEEMPCVLYDVSLVPLMRQYDPSIMSAMDRGECAGNKYLEFTDDLYNEYLENNNTYFILGTFNHEVNLDVLLDDIYKSEVDYFIRNKQWFSNEYVKSLGFKYIGESENYEIYFIEK